MGRGISRAIHALGRRPFPPTPTPDSTPTPTPSLLTISDSFSHDLSVCPSFGESFSYFVNSQCAHGYIQPTHSMTTLIFYRCPAGIHLPGISMSLTVQLLDSADNEIVRCTAESRFCHTATNTLLYAALFAGGRKVSDEPQGNTSLSVQMMSWSLQLKQKRDQRCLVFARATKHLARVMTSLCCAGRLIGAQSSWNPQTLVS